MIRLFLFHRQVDLSTVNYLLSLTLSKASPSGLPSSVESVVDSAGELAGTGGKEATVGSGFLWSALWLLMNCIILTFPSSHFFIGSNIS